MRRISTAIPGMNVTNANKFPNIDCPVTKKYSGKNNPSNTPKAKEKINIYIKKLRNSLRLARPVKTAYFFNEPIKVSRFIWNPPEYHPNKKRKIFFICFQLR